MVSIMVVVSTDGIAVLAEGVMLAGVSGSLAGAELLGLSAFRQLHDVAVHIKIASRHILIVFMVRLFCDPKGIKTMPL